MLDEGQKTNDACAN